MFLALYLSHLTLLNENTENTAFSSGHVWILNCENSMKIAAFCVFYSTKKGLQRVDALALVLPCTALGHVLRYSTAFCSVSPLMTNGNRVP